MFNSYPENGDPKNLKINMKKKHLFNIKNNYLYVLTKKSIQLIDKNIYEISIVSLNIFKSNDN